MYPIFPKEIESKMIERLPLSTRRELETRYRDIYEGDYLQQKEITENKCKDKVRRVEFNNILDSLIPTYPYMSASYSKEPDESTLLSIDIMNIGHQIKTNKVYRTNDYDIPNFRDYNNYSIDKILIIKNDPIDQEKVNYNNNPQYNMIDKSLVNYYDVLKYRQCPDELIKESLLKSFYGIYKKYSILDNYCFLMANCKMISDILNDNIDWVNDELEISIKYNITISHLITITFNDEIYTIECPKHSKSDINDIIIKSFYQVKPEFINRIKMCEEYIIKFIEKLF